MPRNLSQSSQRTAANDNRAEEPVVENRVPEDLPIQAIEVQTFASLVSDLEALIAANDNKDGSDQDGE